MSLRSGLVSRTEHAQWSSSRSIPHRSRRYWLRKEKHREEEQEVVQLDVNEEVNMQKERRK